MTRSALFLVVLSVVPVSLGAQQKRPLVPEDLYRLKTATDATVSPDGRWVVYVQSTVDSAKNRYSRDLWAAAGDGTSRRRLTWTPESNESAPVFSPDGRYIAFLTSREGDERFAQVYVLPFDRPGEARRVTAQARGTSRPVWSPDGTKLAYTASLTADERKKDEAKTPADTTKPTAPLNTRDKLARNAEKNDPRVIDRLSYVGEQSFQEERWSQVYIIDALNEAAKAKRITHGDFDHNSPVFTPDGKSVVYAAGPPKGEYHPDYEQDTDLYVVAVDGSGAPRNLTPGGGTGLPAALAGRAGVPRTPAGWSERSPLFSRDGKWLAYVRESIGEHAAAANSELILAHADGRVRACVSCALDRSVNSFRFDEQNRLYFTVPDRGGVHLYGTAPDDPRPRPLITGPRGVLSFDVNGRTLAWTEARVEYPSDVYAATYDAQRERRLTTLNDSLLSAVQVQPYEEMWYRAPDGARLQAWIIRPANFRAREHPLLVEMHGGPHAMWGPGEASMWLEYQSLAGASYTVFLSNPRGSEGYGFDFKKAIHRNWGALPMSDVLTGADSVLARGWADPARQGIIGGSYAGYLTAWIIGHTNRFKGAVAQRGVFDMVSWWGMANTWRLFESEFGVAPWEDPQLAWQASPIAYADKIQTPLLLLHGEQDFRVGLGGVQTLFRMLKAQGKTTQLVLYPREGHELTRSGEPAHRIDHMLRIIDWMDRYVK